MDTTMRASVLTRPQTIELQERPVPEPGADEVLVRVGSVGVCGSDVHYYKHGRIGSSRRARACLLPGVQRLRERPVVAAEAGTLKRGHAQRRGARQITVVERKMATLSEQPGPKCRVAVVAERANASSHSCLASPRRSDVRLR
jgi:hypothetical protein